MSEHTDPNPPRLLLELNDPQAELVANEDGRYLLTLTLTLEGRAVRARLSPTALQVLGLQCVTHLPDLTPRFTVASIEESYRQPAMLLKYYPDRQIQRLLRELTSDCLIDFVWYMDDEAILDMMTNNLSKRAAELFLDDLEDTWGGKDPNNALEFEVRRGREAVMQVMNTLQRMVDEGAVDDIAAQLTDKG